MVTKFSVLRMSASNTALTISRTSFRITLECRPRILYCQKQLFCRARKRCRTSWNRNTALRWMKIRSSCRRLLLCLPQVLKLLSRNLNESVLATGLYAAGICSGSFFKISAGSSWLGSSGAQGRLLEGIRLQAQSKSLRQAYGWHSYDRHQLVYSLYIGFPVLYSRMCQ